MAELTPIPAAQRPSDPAYQPVSGYAVGAGVVAGLFALALVALVVVGLLYRETPFSYPLLALPVAGIVLSIVARSHIRNSEGTRTGVKLANTAWWVCVLGGAGFAAFLMAIEVVMRAESRRPADAFLATLQSGNEQEAFYRYVLPPDLRGRPDPGSSDFEAVYSPSGYGLYGSCDLVQMFRLDGPAAEFQHLGAKDIGPEGNGFKATHIYRLTFPEGSFDVQIKMVASEARPGAKPEWHVQLSPGLGITKPQWNYFSQYGRLVFDLSQEAGRVAETWMSHVSKHRPGLVHLYTGPGAEREAGETALGAAAVFGGAVVYATPLTPAGPGGFDALHKAGFFRLDESGAPLPDAKVAKLRNAWGEKGSLTPASNQRRNTYNPDPNAVERPTIVVSPTAITIGVPADVIYGTGRADFATGTIGLECTEPDVVAAVNAARQHPDVKDDGSVTPRTLKPRHWRVVWLRTDMETPATALIDTAGPARRPGVPNTGFSGGPGGP